MHHAIFHSAGSSRVDKLQSSSQQPIMTKPIVTKEEKEYNATRWCVSPRPQREAKTKAIAKKTWTKVLQKAPKKPVVVEVEEEEYVPSDPSYCPTSPIYRPLSPRPPYYCY